MSTCSYIIYKDSLFAMESNQTNAKPVFNAQAEQASAGVRDLIPDAQAVTLARTFQALADTTRIRLIGVLLQSEMRVGDLAAALVMTQSAVSHQLRLLRDLHIVKGRRHGREIFYSLDDDHVRDLFIFGLQHVKHL